MIAIKLQYIFICQVILAKKKNKTTTVRTAFQEVVVVNVEVLQEFRALLYKVEVKCFENHVNDPPLQQWPGSMVSHLTIAWD